MLRNRVISGDKKDQGHGRDDSVQGGTLDNPLNWEMVFVFNKKKDKHWQVNLDQTINILNSLQLESQQEHGEIDPDNIFLLVGSYEASLRKYAVSKLNRMGNRLVDSNTKFTEAERLNLIESKLLSSSLLRRVLEDGVIERFPYHQPDKLQQFRQQWYHGRLFNLPIEIANEYFGEEISFYFLFLKFYIFTLFLVSFISLAFSVIQYMGDPNMLSNGIFAIFVTVMSSFFLDFWKRFSNDYSWNWNMEDFVDKEVPRPGFKSKERRQGVYHQSLLLTDGDFDRQELTLVKNYFADRPYFTRVQERERVFVYIFTFAVATALILLVPIFSISVFAVPYALGLINFRARPEVEIVITTICIQIFNYFYNMLAIWLTDKENHRLQSNYTTSLSIKLFLFQFLNMFSGLFYYAFIRDNSSIWGELPRRECSDARRGLWNQCVADLEFSLFTLFVVNFTFGMLGELVLPKLQYAIGKMMAKEGKVNKKSSLACEEQFYLPSFDTFSEYNEMVLQYAMICMFASALPISSLLALLNNVMENKTDAYKLCFQTRRPLYNGSKGIGYWYHFMVGIGFLSVITNSMLVGFSFPTLTSFTKSDYAVLWIVVGMEHIVMLVKYLVQTIIPDDTYSLRKIKSARDFVKTCILDRYHREKGSLNSPTSSTSSDDEDVRTSSMCSTTSEEYRVSTMDIQSMVPLMIKVTLSVTVLTILVTCYVFT
ncbi:hypothetical protein SAMD00019534_022070 [Acytostelium subglobosum LB1]|uniref:hypothetical protein n=1 Tax=Acytostelium subglobosum LB1 TaxID=1410327 RepID=UPI000644B284|nr:hypothetical protein SAMD00019534_022070 [Acytostelium subglobosum LB1]GAM19032.1 hypothetical protein SAMD00019534_022070 [Acytostelium subglobosum LB1]|eukprot:XP_012756959.1 hypothetical protein SAMD00019534_022070 [Acytostelium subglobosum LB1]